MKIIMIANGMDIGGAETHILELSTVLCQRGHFVTVAAPYGAYTKELKKRGIKTEIISTFDGSLSSLGRQMRELFEVIRRNRPDVLHAHTRPGALLSVLLGKMLSIPVVGTAHLPFEKKGLRDRSTRWGDCVLAVSEDIANHLMTHYSRAKNDISVIRNGIDTDKFIPKGNVSKKIVHVSRLDHDRSRAAELLISIAPNLAKLKVCEQIVIVGDGALFKKMKQETDAVNRQIGYEYVQMLGSRTDIDQLLEDRPVFVGVSRAALEAMSCECTVILCGNEGYDGILDQKKFEKAAKKNFCCRNHIHATDERLFFDLKAILMQSDEERKQKGRMLRDLVVQHFQRMQMADVSEIAYKKAVRKKDLGIMLCGYYGYGNIGDEATLPLIIHKCLRYYERVTVMSCHPKQDTKKYGVKCIGRFSILSFLKNFHYGDLLIFGGGNLLQNQTSQRSLLYYLLIAILAKIKKGRIAIVRGGIGDLHGRFSKKAVELLLKNCDYITCRTLRDQYQAKKIGALQRVNFASDASLFLPIERKKTRFPLLKSNAYCVIVLKKEPEAKLKQKIAFVNQFCYRHCLLPVLIAFDEKNDTKTVKKAASMMPHSVVIKTQNQKRIRRMISLPRMTGRMKGSLGKITKRERTKRKSLRPTKAGASGTKRWKLF